ncbi:MAG TPA: hypothetical protein VGC00_04325 [Thermoanaerobaculia bacterium]|jgi:hypothetical protein
MPRTLVVGCLSFAVALFAAACGAGRTPVGSLEVSPSAIELAWPQFVDVRVRLRAERALPEGARRPIVFLHLLDEPGSVVRTFDHGLPGEWAVGHEFDYSVRVLLSALAEPLPAGEYLLSVGLYAPDHGRFALRTDADEVAKLEYLVAPVAVPATDTSAPRARFSDGWLPPEPGADRQILARRSLVGGTAGTVEFGPLAGPGTLLVRVEIPEETRDRARVELAAGESQPKLRVASSCGGEQVEVSGAGGFDLDFAVSEATAACELVFAPNFQIRWRNRAEATSARLAVLAWRPGSSGAPPP